MNQEGNYILNMPPFLGVSRERLMSLIERICLEFKTYNAGETILYPGMEARRLMLLLKGPVVIEREPVNGIKVCWKLKEGNPIDLPALFSLSLSHSITAKALGKVEIVAIDRLDFRKMYEVEPVILINLLNILGRAASSSMAAGDDIVEFWIRNLSEIESTNAVKLVSSLKRIGELTSSSPDAVKDKLEHLEQQGLITWLRDEHAILICQCGDGEAADPDFFQEKSE